MALHPRPTGQCGVASSKGGIESVLADQVELCVVQLDILQTRYRDPPENLLYIYYARGHR